MAIKYKYNPTVSIVSIGYNENKHLLRQHYRSILRLRDPFKRYWFMSDGPTSDPSNDMATVFREVFPQGEVIELPFILRFASPKEKAIWREAIKAVKKRTKYIFISQPHADKRRAMYTAIKAILLKDKPELILSTDSDTKFASNVISEMSMPFVDTRVGAVTGDVRILNHSKKSGGSILSFLSSLRYWQAFHLERAAQSLFGVVYCVSGPLGAYRSVVWKEMLDDWSSQKFMGRFATTGDDRCATNYTLRSKGKRFGEAWKVHFTPYTYCETETPTTLLRWIKQQERWSRSFFREAQFTYRWIHKHHTWLTIDIVYHIFFPFFLFASILWQGYTIATTGQAHGALIFLFLILLSGLMRSIYGAILTKRKNHFFLAGYGFLYMAFLIWVKLFALLFVWRNGWGTSTRHNMDYILSESRV
jgi:hyaluronan synthase